LMFRCIGGITMKLMMTIVIIASSMRYFFPMNVNAPYSRSNYQDDSILREHYQIIRRIMMVYTQVRYDDIMMV
jgi:hypothetical protein